MKTTGRVIRSTLEASEAVIKNTVGDIKTYAGDLENYTTRGVDKITGLIIARDEGPHQVSDFPWRSSMFKFRATLHHGIPGSPSAIAFDCTQRMFAMGTARGLVKIFGKPGVEGVVNQYSSGISFLEFVNNSGKLIIVYNSVCTGVNLDTRRSIGNYDFKTEVCCIKQLASTPFIWVGLVTGNVHVLSVGNKIGACGYVISAKNHLELKQSTPVSALEIHPSLPNVLLIAHESGSLLEWDIEAERIIRRYQVPDSCGTLTTAVWHPSGTKLIAGFKNGDLYAWRRSDPTPNKTYKMTFHPTTPRRPIKRLYWTQFEGKNFLCTFGGTSISHEAAANIAIRYQKQMSLIPPVNTKKSQQVKPYQLVDMVVVLPGSFSFCTEPLSVIGISSNADIFVYAPARGGTLRAVNPPPNFRFQASPITSTLFSNISKGFLNDLASYGNSHWSARDWILQGGNSSLQPQSSTDILVTGHSDGNVFFWDMSNTHFNLIYWLNIRFITNVTTPSIESIDLCVESRTLAVSCTSGETFVYYFSDIASPLSKQQSEEYTQRCHEWKLETVIADIIPKPISGATILQPSVERVRETFTEPTAVKPVASIPTQSSPVTKPERTQKREKRKTSQPSDDAGALVFSWTKFFLNAGVDSKAAAQYAEFFDSQKMTDDLVPDIDESDMRQAGITTVGDQKRVMRYIKSNYSREQCLEVDASAPSKEPSERRSRESKSKKRSEKSGDKERKHRTKRSERRTVEDDDMKRLEKLVEQAPVQTKSIALEESRRSPIVDSPEPVRSAPTPIRELAPGFQLKTLIPLRRRITQIKIGSSLSKIAIGDAQGSVALLDIVSGTVLLHKDLSANVPSAVVWLCFDDRAIVEKAIREKKKKRAVQEPGLFVGLQDGRIFYIALKTAQVDRITTEDNEMGLSSILLLDGIGAPVLPQAEPWKSTRQLQEERERAQLENENEELVIRNLDEELPRENSKSSIRMKGPVALEDQKFVLVCTGEFIRIYALPSYNLYSEYECAETPESANLVEYEGNWCLVVFLSSGTLQVLSLMDLQEIKSVPQALQSIGIQFDPRRLVHDVNCARDGRFVVLSKYQEVIRGSLFEDENLLGLPYSLPRLYVPDVAMSPAVEVGLIPFLNMNYAAIFGMVKYQGEQKPQPVQATQNPPTRSTSGKMPKEHRNYHSQPARQPEKKPVPTLEEMTKLNPKLGVGERLVKTVGSGVSDVTEIMTQNFSALAVRKEKLDELLISSEQLANRSSAFASIANDLAEKESSRKWWQ